MTINNNVAGIASMRRGGTKLWKKRVRKLLNNKLALIGMIVLFVMVMATIFAPLLTSYDPMKPDFSNKFAAPSAEHILGCDSMGRDQFSRLLYGGRTSILIAVLSATIACTIGIVLGAIGGYFGGIVDKLLLRISEIFYCIPSLILIIIVMGMIGSGTFNLILVFGLTGWTGTFRLVRAEYIARKEETYVQVCQAFGMKKSTIMFKQILPAVLSTVVVQFTMNLPGYVMSEAGLSYLGFGVPMSIPTWGTMLNAAKTIKVLLYNPAVWIVPGAAICLFVLSVNFFGDGLRDVMDPKQQ